jgi:ubiquinone/menaquinone biosynthesis C-methylase UbiE
MSQLANTHRAVARIGFESGGAMDKRSALEFDYGRRLRECGSEERQALYAEAYSKTVEAGAADMPKDIESRTAGTSRGLVTALQKICRSGDAVLEVGCGRGYTCLKLAPYVGSIVGTDVSEPSLRETAQILEDHGVANARTVAVNAFDLDTAFEPASFDKIISIDLIEHLHPDDALTHLKSAYAILKPGGAMIVVSPNRVTGPHDITRAHFPDSREPKGFHLNELSQRELVDTLKTVGFERFQPFASHAVRWLPFSGATYPVALALRIEALFESGPTGNRYWLRLGRLLTPFLRIRMIAYKGGAPAEQTLSDR